MVEIKNISVKPICIGGVSLLPGTSNTVEDAFMDAVNFYVDMGFVEIQKKKNTRATRSGKAVDSDAPADESPAGES